MAITAAEVEANGWVLRITLTGALGDFGSYVLDPSGAPRVVLTSSHAGFTAAGGAAVAGTMVRQTPVGHPVRLPVNPLSPLVKVIDETDLGGGVIRCRLALAEWIYATDTGLSLAVMAGWRSGEVTASGIAVANGSTIAAPVPIFRWALAPYEVTAGSFRLSLFVASHHPVGFDPVAGVKFFATDGVNTRTAWQTSLSTDDSYGDNLRCYSAIIDPGAATALTAGLLRCDAEVYPFLGAMRSTDTAGTRSMSGLNLAGYGNAAATPFVIGHDPLGTRYSNQFAFVDAVSGTTTASAAMIGATWAAAKAVAGASRPRDAQTALQAAKLKLRALPAANGGAAAAQSVDGLRIRFAAGTHVGLGGAAVVTTGITCTEIPVSYEGDPDDPNPRVNCVLQTGVQVNPRIIRARWRNLALEIGGTSFAGSMLAYNFFDNIEMRGKAGSETAINAPFLASAVAGNWHLCVTRSRLWRTGWDLNRGNSGVGLLRGSAFSRRAAATTILKNRWIPVGEDGFSSGTGEGISTWQTSTQIGAVEDFVVAFNDMRSISAGQGLTIYAPPAATVSGTLNPSHRRHAVINNVFERITATSDNMWSYGEGALRTISYLVVEGNTVAGAGYNAFYSDPKPLNPTEADTLYNEAFVIRHANNAVDRNASKQDDFNDPDTATARGGGAHGYRPQMIHAWGPHMGVGMEGHVDCSRSGTWANFRRDFAGIRGVQFAGPTAPGWTDDRSERGSNTGQGNYLPVAGSVFAGRVMRGNSDRDWAGNPRRAGGFAGAFEPLASTDTALVPGNARPAHSVGGAATGWSGSIAPHGGRSAHLAGVAAFGWAGGLAPAAARMAERSGMPALVNGAVPVLSVAPGAARQAMASGMTSVLPGVSPPGAVAALRVLLVRRDPRRISIN
ncbi:hypothetical protein GCM10011529_01040 [Polymorphobacter glacialis]|uniref:Uncharacterized protein n=1 Tax=Sandarakinorhabdus glacialis TaxID=1614636 RepID=A0A917E3X5_9SPHN|nr:hypothetical protein [Polymorphobacter glacialis]GGD98743.1 hypothetical protein GCM10011529_01040 [Polymorphobacter glacialis]